MRKQIRISHKQLEALKTLAAELNISGQRGTFFQALILHIADAAASGLPEMVAALGVGFQCAAGGDWHELIEAIEPKFLTE